MTKVELALVLKTIDAHTTRHLHNYGPGEYVKIEDVAKLKADIIHQYENFMKEDAECQ